MDNQCGEPSETVILVLGNHRLKANKNKLVSKSQYFACLSAKNFSEYLKKEFPIEVEVSLETLQDFVDWVNDEDEDSHSAYYSTYEFTVQKSLRKFLTGKYSDLFELLRLSVIFAAKKLTENVTEMISAICMRIPPDKVLETWQLAEHQDLKVFKDVALSVCLEKINDIPIASLVKLSFENFSKLVCNVNANCTSEQLMKIRKAWIQGNSKPPNLDDSSLRFIQGRSKDVLQAVEEGRETHCQQCIAGQEINGTQFIYSWDGDTVRQLVELPREIIGWRFLGKGFYIYVVGRRMSVNSGNFNTTIWRYCIFNKKWVVEATLPRLRQFMQVVFLGSKLYLFGGTIIRGESSPAMDVYDIYTGVWSEAKEPPAVPEEFESQPMGSVCVGYSKILYQRAFMLQIYNTLIDVWKPYDLRPPPALESIEEAYDHKFHLMRIYKPPNLTSFCVTVRYGGQYPSRDRMNLVIFIISRNSFGFVGVIHAWPPVKFHEQIFNGSQMVRFTYYRRRVTVEVGEVSQSSIPRPTGTYKRLKVHSQEILKNGSTLTDHGCFNLNNADTLQTRITMPESVKIETTTGSWKRRKHHHKELKMSN